jgi:hypothetical protein
MFKSLKQHPAAKIWGKITTRPMQRDLKNLKISVETHQRLKIFAASQNVPIMECADLMIRLCLDKKISDAKIAKALSDLKKEQSCPDG